MDTNEEAEAAYGDLQGTGTRFRQARLSIAGTFYKFFIFSNEYEFLDGDADLVEGWVGAGDIIKFRFKTL